MIGGEGAWSGDDQPSPYCCQELAPVTRCHLLSPVHFHAHFFQWWQHNSVTGWLISWHVIFWRLKSTVRHWPQIHQELHITTTLTRCPGRACCPRGRRRGWAKNLCDFFISIKNCSCVIKRWEREKKENGRKTWILKVKWAKRAATFFPIIVHDSHFEDETLTSFITIMKLFKRISLFQNISGSDSIELLCILPIVSFNPWAHGLPY